MAFERISVNPDKMAGVPCIRDLRMPVASVVAMVADGMSVDEILGDFPDLVAEDAAEALRYAAAALLERELPLRHGSGWPGSGGPGHEPPSSSRTSLR